MSYNLHKRANTEIKGSLIFHDEKEARDFQTQKKKDGLKCRVTPRLGPLNREFLVSWWP